MGRTPVKPKGYFGKRAFDVVGATLALAVGTIPIGIIALLVRFKLGKPILFTQERSGLDGATFRMIKFRSMTDARDADGNLLPDELRLPPFGLRLRSTSLDELPELLNVLKGDMSLVGPRPLLSRYLTRYSPKQARRLEVRPGLTGWAQVNGRNELDWESRFELDVWYVDNISFLLDLKIFFKTIGAVLNRKGVSSGTHTTMPEFLGSEGESLEQPDQVNYPSP